jgi:DNA-binding transcriptional ArsR family regulator
MAVDTLSSTFAALADPTRRAILARLATGPATVKELSELVKKSGINVVADVRNY